MNIRIKFAKEGTMKFIGHLDMMRYFQKIMRRADVDICYSTGFSPHQIMSFASPLGVGMESRGEYVDIEVKSTDSSEEMLRRINEVMVDDSEVLSYRLLPDDADNAMSIVSAADYRLRFREGYEPEDWRDFMDGLLSFMKQEQILIIKKTKKSEKEVDIRPMIYELHEEDDHAIFLKVATGSAANLKPSAVIQAYMDSRSLPLSEFALMITRLEIYAQKKNDPSTLISLEEFGEEIK